MPYSHIYINIKGGVEATELRSLSGQATRMHSIISVKWHVQLIHICTYISLTVVGRAAKTNQLPFLCKKIMRTRRKTISTSTCKCTITWILTARECSFTQACKCVCRVCVCIDQLYTTHYTSHIITTNDVCARPHRHADWRVYTTLVAAMRVVSRCAIINIRPTGERKKHDLLHD